MYASTVSTLKILTLPLSEIPRGRIRVVDFGTKVIKVPNRNPADPNTAVEAYFQYDRSAFHVYLLLHKIILIFLRRLFQFY